HKNSCTYYFLITAHNSATHLLPHHIVHHYCCPHTSMFNHKFIRCRVRIYTQHFLPLGEDSWGFQRSRVAVAGAILCNKKIGTATGAARHGAANSYTRRKITTYKKVTI